MQISLNFKTSCSNLKIKSGKTVHSFSVILILKGIMTKSLCILLSKNIHFNKKEMESKMENLTQFLKDELCASAHTRTTY